MSGWGCPHELNGVCQQVPGSECNPGMKGCVLHGRVRFSSEVKNSPRVKRINEQSADRSGEERSMRDLRLGKTSTPSRGF